MLISVWHIAAGTPETVKMHYKLIDKENDKTKEKASADSNDNGGGLRNRKSKEGGETKKEWSISDDSTFVDEETKLRMVDSIDLFGLPTKELRQAKKEAYRAVALYVEAANLLLALQQEMSKQNKKWKIEPNITNKDFLESNFSYRTGTVWPFNTIHVTWTKLESFESIQNKQNSLPKSVESNSL